MNLSDDRDAVAGFVRRQSEGRHTPLSDRAVLAFGRPFEVLREVFVAANDEEVLETAGDGQLPAREGAEVAGSEVRSSAVVRVAVERRILLALPVPARDTPPGDPDLTDFVVTASTPGLRIDREDLNAEGGRAAAHGLARLAAPGAARHEQRRFGKAVARAQRRRL